MALLQTPYYHSFGKPYYWVYGTEHDRFYNLDGNIYRLWYGNNTSDIAYDAAGRIQAFMNSDLPVYQERGKADSERKRHSTKTKAQLLKFR